SESDSEASATIPSANTSQRSQAMKFPTRDNSTSLFLPCEHCFRRRCGRRVGVVADQLLQTNHRLLRVARSRERFGGGQQRLAGERTIVSVQDRRTQQCNGRIIILFFTSQKLPEKIVR